MAFIVWTPGMQAENAVPFDTEHQDREAWEIHRRGTRAQIEADIAQAENLLAAPEMEPWYAENFDRPTFDARMTAVIEILRRALAHKDREEKDPRYAQLYAALESARHEACAAISAVYEKGLGVDLTALAQAVQAASNVGAP